MNQIINQETLSYTRKGPKVTGYNKGNIYFSFSSDSYIGYFYV